MSHYNKDIIKVLDRMWKKCPELRLGQLIENATTKEQDNLSCCIYYMEDNVFLERLLKFEEKHIRNVG